MLAHLRACAELWGFSIFAMLAEKDPVLALPDERRWAKAAGYTRLDFATSLQVFSQQRGELLEVLGELDLDGWGRGAQIDGRRHTIFSQARRMAKHEGEHCTQIEELCRS